MNDSVDVIIQIFVHFFVKFKNSRTFIFKTFCQNSQVGEYKFNELYVKLTGDRGMSKNRGRLKVDKR
jgi:hypothetical protein